MNRPRVQNHRVVRDVVYRPLAVPVGADNDLNDEIPL